MTRWRARGDLVADELLVALGIDPAAIEDVSVVDGGCSGARLLRLTARGATSRRERRVVKLLTPRMGHFPPTDPLLRELRLYESGLLADLPRAVATGVMAWARMPGRDGRDAGALLLRDESRHLLRDPLHAPPGSMPIAVAFALDRLAQMHARYWGDGRLRDPALGLLPADEALLLMAPATVTGRRACGDDATYLRDATAGWETFFRLIPSATRAALRTVLDDPGSLLRVLAALPATLCHGDVWGPNLGGLPPSPSRPRRAARLLLLDWGLATAGPATYDPLWLAATWPTLAPPRVLAVYRAHLARDLATRGIALDSATWLALADAGYLRTTLTRGHALGLRAMRAAPGRVRSTAENRLRWWAERAAAAMGRLREHAEGQLGMREARAA